MEKGVKEEIGSKTRVCSEKTADSVDGEDDSETCSLLPARKGGRSKKSRKVRWNDHNGNKLAEVLEFDPSGFCSEKGESDEEDSDPCICTVV